MKFRYTLPKNEAFFMDYAGLTGTIKTLGYLAQIVSALTEFGIIYALVESSLIDFFPNAARPVGIFGAAIGTAFLEVGLRKFLPYSAKALLYKRFSGLHLLITCFVFTVTIGLLLSSGYLSFHGSKELIRTTAPPPKVVNLNSADTTEHQNRISASAQYSADSSEASSRYSILLDATKKSYSAKIALESEALSRLEAMERPGKRYTTQKAAIKAKIMAVQAQQAQDIARMENDKATALGEAIKARNASFAKAASEREAARLTIDSTNKLEEAQNTQQVERYGSGLAWFTIIALGILILSVSIDEIHKKGSGIEEALLPNQYYFSQGIFGEAVAMLSDKWNYSTRSIIRRMAASTPTPMQPEPAPELWEVASGMLRSKPSYTTHTAGSLTNLANEYATESRPVIQGFKRTENPSNEISYAHQADGVLVVDSALKPCQHCGQQFRPKVTWQKYCSEECKLAFHAQKHGKPFNPSRYHNSK